MAHTISKFVTWCAVNKQYIVFRRDCKIYWSSPLGRSLKNTVSTARKASLSALEEYYNEYKGKPKPRKAHTVRINISYASIEEVIAAIKVFMLAHGYVNSKEITIDKEALKIKRIENDMKKYQLFLQTYKHETSFTPANKNKIHSKTIPPNSVPIMKATNISHPKLNECLQLPLEWKTTNISSISPFFSYRVVQKLCGGKKKYPKEDKGERIEFEEVRLTYIFAKNHIRYKQLRVELHVAATNMENGRVVGSVEEKKKKKKIKRKIRKKEIWRKALRKRISDSSHSKMGQIFDTSCQGDSSKMFYETLFTEDPESIMAISYLLFFGCFSHAIAAEMYKSNEQMLCDPANYCHDYHNI